MGASRCAYKSYIILNGVRSAQLLYYSRYLHRLNNSTIYYSSSGLIFSFNSQDAMHTLESLRVYSHGIHKIE